MQLWRNILGTNIINIELFSVENFPKYGSLISDNPDGNL